MFKNELKLKMKKLNDREYEIVHCTESAKNLRYNKD